MRWGGLRLRGRCQVRSLPGAVAIRRVLAAPCRTSRHPTAQAGYLVAIRRILAVPCRANWVPGRYLMRGRWRPAAQAGIRPCINVPSQPSALLRLKARLQLDARPQPNARQRRKFMIEVLKVLSES